MTPNRKGNVITVKNPGFISRYLEEKSQNSIINKLLSSINLFLPWNTISVNDFLKYTSEGISRDHRRDLQALKKEKQHVNDTHKGNYFYIFIPPLQLTAEIQLLALDTTKQLHTSDLMSLADNLAQYLRLISESRRHL